jgi:hypothetical protein
MPSVEIGPVTVGWALVDVTGVMLLGMAAGEALLTIPSACCNKFVTFHNGLRLCKVE